MAHPTPDEARAEVAGITRLIWLKSGLVGATGRALQIASGDPGTKDFYENQVAAILGFRRLNAWEKCRQMGQSFAFAADSLARAALEPNTTAAHISTDKWESQSKQGYVLRILDALPTSHKNEIKLKSEAQDRLVLETKKGVATINFLAQRDPRGMERGGVYLHEMAHMPKLKEILKGAVASTLRGGFIKGCSTHEGAGSEFNLIMTNAPDEETGEKPYAGWNTGSYPWWTCPTYCRDVARALKDAPDMETDERVSLFGTPPLQDMRRSSSLEQFREECECEVVDSRYSYFPEELIAACACDKLIFDKVEVSGSKMGAVGQVKEKIDWLARQIEDGSLRGVWAWGYDVGRYHNPDAISIGHTPQGDNHTLQLNLCISMENMDWEPKQEVIAYIMRHLPVVRGAQDQTGMGMQLAAWAVAKFGQRAHGVTFNNMVKCALANDVKIRMEKRSDGGTRRLTLPRWGKLSRQFNSIRKIVLPSGAATYDSTANDNTHADLFWSVALLNSCFDKPTGNYAFTPTVGRRPDSGGLWDGQLVNMG